MFRVAGSGKRGPRVLALMAPGDLMVNTPLDFITAHLGIRLDLLWLLPDVPMPEAVPDHDVAFFAVSESDPATLRRLTKLYGAWPRPVCNDPSRVAALSRDGLARDLSDIDTMLVPPVRRVGRAELKQHGCGHRVLVRPAGSHAGNGLAKLEDETALSPYLAASTAEELYLTQFVDYRGPDGLFRKYRIAFIDGASFLCHMAVSAHWMVHYLNAGMTDSAEKRAEEAREMACFDTGFARRHAAAFEALTGRLELDYFSIDCAESPDGRLLLFEADVAAIIHMMDPPDLFPYKQPQMRRVFDAFGAMLRRRSRLCLNAPLPHSGRRACPDGTGS